MLSISSTTLALTSVGVNFRGTDGVVSLRRIVTLLRTLKPWKQSFQTYLLRYTHLDQLCVYTKTYAKSTVYSCTCIYTVQITMSCISQYRNALVSKLKLDSVPLKKPHFAFHKTTCINKSIALLNVQHTHVCNFLVTCRHLVVCSSYCLPR